jgi:uncharacterized iron-regulated protein
MGGGTMGHASENLPKAQAVKDATMANSIVKIRQEGQKLIHFNGSYHSGRYMGIIWYLNKYQPGTRIVTLATVQQDDISTLSDDFKGDADYLIVIPSSMTKTFGGGSK